MRALHENEFESVSGGIDTTTLHTVQVNGPSDSGTSDSSMGGYDTGGSNGISPNEGHLLCDLIGGIVGDKRVKDATLGTVAPAKKLCNQGVTNLANGIQNERNAISCQTNGGSYNNLTHVCTP